MELITYSMLPRQELKYVTLQNKEECDKVEYMGCFYRVFADNRDFNYAKFSIEALHYVSNEVLLLHSICRLNLVEIKVIAVLEYNLRELAI